MLNDTIWIIFGLFNCIVILPIMDMKSIYKHDSIAYVLSFLFGPFATLIHIMVIVLYYAGILRYSNKEP